jgi:hypothetical protein
MKISVKKDLKIDIEEVKNFILTGSCRGQICDNCNLYNQQDGYDENTFDICSFIMKFKKRMSLDEIVAAIMKTQYKFIIDEDI